MITHKYIDPSRFYSGLPAQDLDASTLTDEQKAILSVAVGAGVYKPVSSSAPTSPTDNTAKKKASDS